MSAAFRAALQLTIRGGWLSLLIFDEGGLAAEWGGDVRGFRPEYGKLAVLRSDGVPALVLEACLAPHARALVARAVGLRAAGEGRLDLDASVVRQNVKLVAEPSSQAGAARIAQRAAMLHSEHCTDGGGGTLVLHASKVSAEKAAAAMEAQCLTDDALQAAAESGSFEDTSAGCLGVTQVGVYHASKGTFELEQTFTAFENGGVRVLHVTVAIARGADVTAFVGYAPRGASSLSNFLQFLGRLARRPGSVGFAVVSFSWPERCRLLRLALRSGFTDEAALASTVSGINDLYAVCDAHNQCVAPRCMHKTISALMDAPAVRRDDAAAGCGTCTGCRRELAEAAAATAAAAAAAAAAAGGGGATKKRRKASKIGTAYENDVLKGGVGGGGLQALLAMQDAVRVRVTNEIAPTFDELKLGIFKDTGLNAKTVEHWLRMVLCERKRIRDEPPPLGENQKPGKWRVRPVDVVSGGNAGWPMLGGLQVSLALERWS